MLKKINETFFREILFPFENLQINILMCSFWEMKFLSYSVGVKCEILRPIPWSHSKTTTEQSSLANFQASWKENIPVSSSLKRSNASRLSSFRYDPPDSSKRVKNLLQRVNKEYCDEKYRYKFSDLVNKQNFEPRFKKRNHYFEILKPEVIFQTGSVFKTSDLELTWRVFD